MKKTLLTKFLMVSKITLRIFIVLCVFAQFTFAGNIEGQNIGQVTIHLRKQKTTLKELIKEIEGKTHFSFFYDDGLEELKQEVYLASNEASVKEILSEVANQAKLQFREVNSTISIKKWESALGNSAEELTQNQERELAGKVTNEDGEAIPGVTVSVVGTSRGVVTNVDGVYRISVSPDERLSFSFIGFKTQVIPVKDKAEINIVLSQEDMALDEVVVTAVGIKRKEKALGYSVSRVSSEQLDNPAVNVLSSLQGKVTGVNISTLSNDPGSSVLMNIRGATSLNIRHSSANSQPLYVIDGVPITTELTFLNRVDIGNIISDLNPNDIESITVLKGASAAALYGSEAGNGVVMITTKVSSRKKKGIGIEYNVSSLVNTVFKTLELQKEFAGGDRDIYRYANVGDGWGPSLYGNVTGTRWNMRLQEWEYDVPLTSAKEDRLKSFLETGITTSHNVTINSQDDNGSFRVSYNNLRNKGVMPNTDTYRNSLSFAGIRNLNKKLTVSVNATYLRSFSPNRSITTGSGGDGNAIARIYNIANQIQPISDMKEYWLEGSEGIYPNPIMFDGDVADYENPYWLANESINTITKDRTFGKVQADWQILKPLSVMFRSGMDLNSYYHEGRKAWGYSENPTGNYQLNQRSNFTSNTDAILNFEKVFNKFSVNANAGYNYQYINITSSGMSASALARPNDYNISNAAAGADSKSSSWSKSKKQSIYATAQVGYNNMGYIEVTGRKDWGGILEEDKNSYFYPSASLSLIPTAIFKMPEIFDFAKLRLGIAQVGHGMGQPRNRDTYSFASSDWGDVKLVGIGGSLVDANLKNEVTNSIEFGGDLNMFNNRLRADFTIFKKSHLNQLLDVSVPPASGFSSMTTNVGDVISKGYEWSLALDAVKKKDWSWTVSTNFSRAVATIDRLSEAFGDYQIIGVEGYLNYKLAEGEKIGNMYQKYQPVLVEEGKYKGSYLIRWDNGEGFERTRDGDKKKCIGNFNPDFIMGFSTNFSYKNWSLNIVANLRYGGEYVSRTMGDLARNGFLPETLRGGTKYAEGWVGGRDASYGGFAWLSPGSGTNSEVNRRLSDLGRDINDAVYLVGVYVDPSSGLDYSDPNAGDENYIVNGADPNSTLWSTSEDAAYDWIYKFAENRTLDATNFKIKEITLTYNFNRELIQKMRLSNLSLSLIAQNVFHWYASGYNEDPETAFTLGGNYFNQGASRFSMPAVASWGVRLNIGF